MTTWKLSQDGNSASRTNDDGSYESRLLSAIPTTDPILPYTATLVEIREKLRAEVQAMLDKSDKVAWRCVKANVPYPAEWYAVDTAKLRRVH